MTCNPKEKNPSPNLSKKLKEFLSHNNACYVLITCGKPSEDGKMDVEMVYEGDESLVAYLIESAQEIIDSQSEALR